MRYYITYNEQLSSVGRHQWGQLAVGIQTLYGHFFEKMKENKGFGFYRQYKQ